MPEIVNVATVPLRSPFRYPGGKTWLVPTFRRWMEEIGKRDVLIDPFAGGGIIPLTALMEGLVSRLVLIELDPAVASVWNTILRGDCEGLVNRILEFECTRENVVAALNEFHRNQTDRAFLTILRNRVQRGGILAEGAGLINVGENGKGVASRWYPETLANRIRAIREVRDSIEFIEGDAFELLPGYVHELEACFFIDPPYVEGRKKAGNRLYSQREIDHAELFRLVAMCHGPAMLTYADTAPIRRLATETGFRITRCPMKSTHHAEMFELVILK